MLTGRRFELYDQKIIKLMEMVHFSFRMVDMSGGILNNMPFLRYFAPNKTGYTDMKHIIDEIYAFLKASNHTRVISISIRFWTKPMFYYDACFFFFFFFILSVYNFSIRHPVPIYLSSAFSERIPDLFSVLELVISMIFIVVFLTIE